eukprot:Opistho-1_new@38729
MLAAIVTARPTSPTTHATIGHRLGLSSAAQDPPGSRRDQRGAVRGARAGRAAGPGLALAPGLAPHQRGGGQRLAGGRGQSVVVAATQPAAHALARSQALPAAGLHRAGIDGDAADVLHPNACAVPAGRPAVRGLHGLDRAGAAPAGLVGAMTGPHPPAPDSATLHRSRVVRGLFWLAGSVSLALGLVGVVLPGLPTTPFVLLAAACYAKAPCTLR